MVDNNTCNTKSKKGYRNIIIGKYTFQWMVGKTYVCIYDPMGFKDTPTKSEVMGFPVYPDDHTPITPAAIEQYIRRTHFQTVKLN